DGHRLGTGSYGRPRADGQRHFFNQRIPLAAAGTLAQPFGRRIAARVTNVLSLAFGHWLAPSQVRSSYSKCNMGVGKTKGPGQQCSRDPAKEAAIRHFLPSAGRL